MGELVVVENVEILEIVVVEKVAEFVPIVWVVVLIQMVLVEAILTIVELEYVEPVQTAKVVAVAHRLAPQVGLDVVYTKEDVGNLFTVIDKIV